MRKLLSNQKGAIDIVLILVIFVAALGMGGYVYYRQQQANKVYDAAGSGSTVSKHAKKKAVSAVDPTADWTVFTSTKGKYTLKYPASWSKVTCDNNDTTLYLAANSKTVAVCNSDSGSQMVVTSEAGDAQTSKKLEARNSGDTATIGTVTTQTVTVDGVQGVRQSAAIISDVGLLNTNVGTTLITYVFYAKGRTYSADYSFDAKNKSYQDVSADFDTMVKSTLTFN